MANENVLAVRLPKEVLALGILHFYSGISGVLGSPSLFHGWNRKRIRFDYYTSAWRKFSALINSRNMIGRFWTSSILNHLNFKQIIKSEVVNQAHVFSGFKNNVNRDKTSLWKPWWKAYMLWYTWILMLYPIDWSLGSNLDLWSQAQFRAWCWSIFKKSKNAPKLPI